MLWVSLLRNWTSLICALVRCFPLWRLLNIDYWEINWTETVTFTLSVSSVLLLERKRKSLFSCDFSASTGWRLCKASLKWDIHHWQSVSPACQRLSHFSTWDVNKDIAFDFHIDLVDFRARIILWECIFRLNGLSLTLCFTAHKLCRLPVPSLWI